MGCVEDQIVLDTADALHDSGIPVGDLRVDVEWRSIRVIVDRG
jgi:hypothetical protein